MIDYPSLYQILKGRRSIGKVKEDIVPEDVIQKILEAGIWAPNHYQTEPWKFFVLRGQARVKLGEVYAAIYKESLGREPLTDEDQRKLELQKLKPLRAPVIIAAASIPSDKPQVLPREEIAAVSCAVQNMLLAAHALGLGAIWRTGEPAYHPLMKQFFQLREQDELLGFIYLGYPDMPKREGRRIPVEQKTVWMDS